VNFKFFKVKTWRRSWTAHWILNLKIALVFGDPRAVYGRAMRQVSKSNVQIREARFPESNVQVTPVSAVVGWHELWCWHYWSGSDIKMCSVKYVLGWKGHALSVNVLRKNCVCGLSFYMWTLMRTTLVLACGRRLLEEWEEARIWGMFVACGTLGMCQLCSSTDPSER
jgi:hypothetical protein